MAGGALVLAGVGRILAMPELFVLAAGAGALVAAATFAVRLPNVQVQASRELHPPKVQAGGASRVELALRNVGARRTPVVLVRDPFDEGRRQARFLLAPVHPGEVARAAYRLPTEKRGVFTIGPLELEVSDSFGLTSVVNEIAPSTQLTVYPRTDRIVPLPHTRGHDPHAGADHPTALGATGDDFYALRAYEMGDDLRRVHWPSTARLDELMIRQLEMPWQGRATVLLDVRGRSHNEESLELAVSAAASIVTASWGRGSLLRLVTTGGLDTGFAAGHQHVESIMEELATIGPAGKDRLEPVLAGLRGPGNAGALAAIFTAEATQGELERVARIQRRFGALTMVVFERSSYGVSSAGTRRPAGGKRGAAMVATGINVVRVTDRQPFAAAWNQAIAPRTRVQVRQS